MFIGMMWFDNDPKKSLTAKVIEAASCYREKYRQAPNVCFVHPGALAEPVNVGIVMVKPWRVVMPGHLWIGMTEGEA